MVGQIFVNDESSDHCHNGRAKRYFSQMLGVLFQPLRSHLSQTLLHGYFRLASFDEIGIGTMFDLSLVPT